MGAIANEVFLGTATAYLALKDQGFFDGVNQAQSALQNFSGSVDTGMSSMEKFSLSTGKIGMSLTRNVTTPIVAFGKSAVDAFRETEHAFIGVKKTLDPQKLADSFGIAYKSVSDLTDEKLAPAYDKLSDAIWNMTQETSSSYETIAGVMEMAGQLNVALGENGQGIIDFTKNIIMLNDTTDLMGADAAKVLAQMTNILHTSEDDFGRLGATIVDLGNNSATTEADIVSMAKRIAGAGELVSLTDQDILAIAATLQSVGISAEMGGTAFSKVLKKMQTAAETGYEPIIDLTQKTGKSLRELEMLSANDSKAFTELAQSLGMTKDELKLMVKNGVLLENFAEVSGMSAKEFAETWKSEPVKAVEAFAKGLGNVDENGKSTIQMLQDMGFTEVRLSDMLSRLALAQEGFTENLERANRAWSDGTALEIEAERRYTELNAQISQLNEQWKQFRVELAEFIVPILKELMGVASKVIGFLRELPDPIKKAFVEIAARAALIGPVLLGLSRITEVIINMGKLLGPIFNLIKNNGGPIMTAVKNLPSIIGTVANGIKGIATAVAPALSAIAGVASIIAGVGIAISNFVDMWTNGVNVINGLLTVLGTTLAGIGLALLGIIEWPAVLIAALVGAIAVAAAYVHEHWDAVKKWWGDVCDWCMEKWNQFSDWIESGVIAIRDFFKGIGQSISDAFTNAIDWIKEKWNGFKEWWQGLGDSIKEKWENLWNGIADFLNGILLGIYEKIVRWLYDTFGENGIMGEIPEYINALIAQIILAIKDTITFITNLIKDLFNILVDIFTLNFSKLKEDLGALLSHIVEWIDNVFHRITSAIKDIVEIVKAFFSEIYNGIKEFFGNIWDTVKEWFGNLISGVSEFFENLKNNVVEKFEQLRDAIHNAFEMVKEVVLNVIENIKEAFNTFLGFIKNALEGIKEAISNVIEFLKEFVSNAIDAIKEFFQKAVDVVKDLWEKVSTFVKDIFTKIGDFVKNAFSNLWDWIKEFPGKFFEIGKLILSNLWDGLKSIWQPVSDWFQDKFGWISDIVDKVKGAINTVKDNLGIASSLPGHANGLDYVPYDNYVARLHKGERVLTKEENEEYTRGSNNTGGDVFNFYNTQPDPYEYARQMKRAKKELLYT